MEIKLARIAVEFVFVAKVNIFCYYCISLSMSLNLSSLRFLSSTPNLFLL